jgi:ribosomal protein L37AE/L43A
MERMRARRRAGLMLARPDCPECGSRLARRDDRGLFWGCGCGAKFMRPSPTALVRLDAAFPAAAAA